MLYSMLTLYGVGFRFLLISGRIVLKDSLTCSRTSFKSGNCCLICPFSQ